MYTKVRLLLPYKIPICNLRVCVRVRVSSCVSRVCILSSCVCVYVCVFFVCMRDYAGESPAGNGSTWFVERSGSITPFSPKGFHSTFPQLLRPYFLIFTASIPSLIVLFALSFAILSLHPTWPRITRARHVRFWTVYSFDSRASGKYSLTHDE